MKESEAVDRVLGIARAELGYMEKASNSYLDDKTANAGSGNYTKYARDLDRVTGFYNGPKNGFAFCDIFYDWTHYKAWGAELAMKVLCQPKYSAGAGCKYSAGYYQAAGRWHVNDPQKGDQIFFSYASGEYSHTGMVEFVTDSEITTIEGNTSNMVARRTYARNDKTIIGYGRPKWFILADYTPDDGGENEHIELSVGCTGDDVKDLQEKLIKLGYKLPKFGADGDFGQETKAAVILLQKDNGLDADGIVGEKTFAAIDRLLKTKEDAQEGEAVAAEDDERLLFEELCEKGFSLKAISVVLGHGLIESGNECNRLQGDLSQSRSKSIAYTEDVDSGKISKADFIHRGPNGGGYGWLQWTYWSRKSGLWDKAKELCVSIGSVAAAIEWLWDELHQGEYKPVLNALMSDISIREMSDVFMHKFERPADQSEAACAKRAAACQKMYEKYESAYNRENSASTDIDNTTRIMWPPRMLCVGMSGEDVVALQGLLLAHGYAINDEYGVFGESTEEAVRQYQSDAGIESDGVAGPITFGSLTKL